jgi:hypothetical protein
MLDRRRGNQEGKDQGDQEYYRALLAFRQQVQSVIRGVDDIIANLSPAYPKEALSHLSLHFEGISREFTSYTIATSSMFYEVVRRSKFRTIAARAVASQARSVAKLFERYAKKPGSYSPVDSRLEIYKLRYVLDNLFFHSI